MELVIYTFSIISKASIHKLFQYTQHYTLQDGKGVLAPPRLTKTTDSVSVYTFVILNQLRLTPTAPWITGGSRVSHPWVSIRLSFRITGKIVIGWRER